MEEKQSYFKQLEQMLSEVNLDESIKEFEAVLDKLKTDDIRSLIIIGVAYLEGILTEVVLETIDEQRRGTFLKNMKMELSLNFCIEYLYAKWMITDEIYDVINQLRKIRNVYAHTPIPKDRQLDEVNSRILNIEKVISKGWGSTATKDFHKIGSNELIWLFVAIENIGIGLIGLKYRTIPQASMATLGYAEGQTHLGVYFHSARASDEIMNYYRRKFNL